jgi:rod shape-determining protein MreC
LPGGDSSDVARLREENATLRAQLAQSQATVAESAAVARLLSAPSTAGGQLLAARIVAFRTTATGGRTVTLDVGQRDGMEPNLTVVAADGLVGRVISVGPWSCDVRVLGGPDTIVGVRVGDRGSLGTVGGAAPADSPPRARGELSPRPGRPGQRGGRRPGQTLGSVQGRPYRPRIAVGTVVSVDPPRGQLTASAVVRPSVDVARLGVMAVLLGRPRDEPRPQAAH